MDTTSTEYVTAQETMIDTSTLYVLELPSGKQHPVTTREEFTKVVNRIRAKHDSTKASLTGWQLCRENGETVYDHDQNSLFGLVAWPCLVGENMRLAKRGLLAC
jgi:hypothetical protein